MTIDSQPPPNHKPTTKSTTKRPPMADLTAIEQRTNHIESMLTQHIAQSIARFNQIYELVSRIDVITERQAINKDYIQSVHNHIVTHEQEAKEKFIEVYSEIEKHTIEDKVLHASIIQTIETNNSSIYKTKEELDKWINLGKGIWFTVALIFSGIQWIISSNLIEIKSMENDKNVTIKKLEGKVNEMETSIATIISSNNKHN